jgi:FMN reductase
LFDLLKNAYTDPGISAESNMRPLIVGIGGTTRANSSSEHALRLALALAAARGTDVALFTGPAIDLPMYAPESHTRTEAAQRLVATLRRCDGVILASPGYHGSISGLLKNALDYTEDLRTDERPYLDGRAFGLIACASGWQAAGTTLMALRSIAHALRAWPTPMGLAMNSAGRLFGDDGSLVDPNAACQLRVLVEQVVEFANKRIETASLLQQTG